MAVRNDKRKGWIVDFVFQHADGRQERVRKTSPVQTQRGAERYEVELRQEKLNPKPKRKEAPTLSEFAREFMTTYVAVNNKPSEQASKKHILRMHLEPKLGRRKLDTICVRDVEQLKAQMLAAELKPKTVNNVLAVLGRLLTYAVEVEVIEDKPTLRLLKVAPQKFDFLEFAEYERLIAEVPNEPLWGSAILTAGECGMRLGEVLGLHWEDVDLRAGVITVRRAMWHEHLGSPKGGRERKIPMTPRLIAALKSDRHLKSSFVWCEANGDYLTKKMAERAIQRMCRRAGLRSIGWHVLRHTYCSHLAMAAVSPRSIQELAGHQDIRTTMRYMHLAPAALHQAVKELSAYRQSESHGTLMAPNAKMACN